MPLLLHTPDPDVSQYHILNTVGDKAYTLFYDKEMTKR